MDRKNNLLDNFGRWKNGIIRVHCLKNLTDRWIELKFSMSILETIDYNMTETRLF